LAPVTRPSIGRNDPCPCGSGKKFKKCHLGKEDELPHAAAAMPDPEAGRRIAALPPVRYGRSAEMIDALDIEALTGKKRQIRCVDLRAYEALGMSGREVTQGPPKEGGVMINVNKTREVAPDTVFLAISPRVSDSVLVHQLAHVLSYLTGADIPHDLANPLSFEMEIPVEHLEHPKEFGYWLDYLAERFNVVLDAEDTIVAYLYKNEMLLEASDIMRMDPKVLKPKSERILRFLSERGREIDSIICEREGYIGSQVNRD
jgi:hypothetical protein